MKFLLSVQQALPNGEGQAAPPSFLCYSSAISFHFSLSAWVVQEHNGKCAAETVTGEHNSLSPFLLDTYS